MAAMVLDMKPKDFLRLRRARGLAIDVVAGRVWITEDGLRQDSFVGAGGSYRVAGDGLVLVEAESVAGGATIAVFRERP
ncbi:MAG TPA: DUF2917 domain-containing protein [Burkholderiales bacterium]|nr:DUF2917 domain-containing protein [Burkholderiales bacterium]